MRTAGVVRRVSPLVHGGTDVDLMTGAALSSTRRAVLLTLEGGLLGWEVPRARTARR